MRVRITIEMDTHCSRRTFDRCMQEAILEPNSVLGEYGSVKYLATELADNTVLSHDGIIRTQVGK